MVEKELNRRELFYVAGGVAGGLVLGFSLDTMVAQAATQTEAAHFFQFGTSPGVNLTDWIRISSDDKVTIVVSQAEMGQGISTTLPAIVADELGADWSKVHFELAPAAPAYRNPRLNWQFTGNSESLQSFSKLMRQVGATARTLLITAAAQSWKVSVDECTTADSRVIHVPSKRSARFGELIAAAAKLPIPKDAALRPDGELKLIGRAVPRVDVPAKVDGSAVFGIDYRPPGLEGLVFAAIRSARPYGAKLKSVDKAAIKSKPGVIEVIELPNAVAVVAKKYWQARAALQSATISFDVGSDPSLSSETLRARYQSSMKSGPFVTTADLKPQQPFKASGTHEATYELPFQAHAPLEPMNAIAHVQAGKVDVWAPTQGQELARYAAAGVAKVDPKDVQIYRTPFLGGGFGRRLIPDFVVDAVLISQIVKAPVHVIWSREEDLQRGTYRPATLQSFKAELTSDKKPGLVSQKFISPTILKPVNPPLDLSKGIDPSCLEGTGETIYGIPGWKTEFHLMQIPVPTMVYRTTGYGPSLFGLESFIDELAHKAKADPYLYRQQLLANNPRAKRVLDMAAEKAGWGKALAKGKGRGIACVYAFKTFLAQVVEVTVKGREVHVDRVVSVADPGQVYDPEISAAGIEGGIVFGLSTITKDEILFANGGPKNVNFTDYDVVRMKESPRIETFFIESPGVELGGVGEVGPVATPPALVNAIFAATGTRIRTLPLKRSGFTLV